MSKKFLNRENKTICYDYLKQNNQPCVVYLHGLKSSRQSLKAKRLKAYAKKNKYAYLALDYTAHGESEGNPSDFRVARCLNDVLDVLSHEKITNPLYIAGSSLGGWIAFLLAEIKQAQVKGVLTLAAGVDFLPFVWKKILPFAFKVLLKRGLVLGPNAKTKGYCFSYPMFKEAEPYLMLHRKINYKGAVVLAHGDQDTIILPENSFKIKDALESSDVTLHIVKGEGHHLHSYPLEDTMDYLIKKGETHA